MYFSINDIQERRNRVSEAWKNILGPDEAVIIQSGLPVGKPGGLDQTYPFLPNPSYYWLTGRRREAETLVYSKDTGWTSFQKEIQPSEAVWEGERNDVLVAETGRDSKELDSFLQQHKFSNLFHLTQSPVQEGNAFELKTAMDRQRRKKDEAEVALIKKLSGIAQHGYRKIEEILRPGISEREVQIAYESEIYRHGAHTVPYDTIVGAGTNAAILHAIPTQRIVQDGELVLVDAGADIFDYCVDITRTYFSSANVTSQHRDLYNLVLKAHNECIALSKPGAWWKDIHIHAAKVITEGLLQMGILRGSLDQLIASEVAFTFFPHGVGHLVGLRVRDTGHEENIHPKTYFGARLRVDIELEENHLLTVEPGCYFIPALLDDKNVREKHKEHIDWAEVEKWKPVGGVRIEDNILIRPGGNENLTNNVPKISA